MSGRAALNDTVLTVGSFKVAVPINGGWVQVAVSAPKGERGGSGWDPEAEADAFEAEREAAIAWEEMHADTRAAVTRLLREHPDYPRWRKRAPGAPCLES